MAQIVFEINEDKSYKYKYCGESYAMFFLVILKKKCRTGKHFAGPGDARCYWSYPYHSAVVYMGCFSGLWVVAYSGATAKYSGTTEKYSG